VGGGPLPKANETLGHLASRLRLRNISIVIVISNALLCTTTGPDSERKPLDPFRSSHGHKNKSRRWVSRKNLIAFEISLRIQTNTKLAGILALTLTLLGVCVRVCERVRVGVISLTRLARRSLMSGLV
jgi:hypothetical protein